MGAINIHEFFVLMERDPHEDCFTHIPMNNNKRKGVMLISAKMWLAARKHFWIEVQGQQVERHSDGLGFSVFAFDPAYESGLRLVKEVRLVEEALVESGVRIQRVSE